MRVRKGQKTLKDLRDLFLKKFGQEFIPFRTISAPDNAAAPVQMPGSKTNLKIQTHLVGKVVARSAQALSSPASAAEALLRSSVTHKLCAPAEEPPSEPSSPSPSRSPPLPNGLPSLSSEASAKAKASPLLLKSPLGACVGVVSASQVANDHHVFPVPPMESLRHATTRPKTTMKATTRPKTTMKTATKPCPSVTAHDLRFDDRDLNGGATCTTNAAVLTSGHVEVTCEATSRSVNTTSTGEAATCPVTLHDATVTNAIAETSAMTAQPTNLVEGSTCGGDAGSVTETVKRLQ